MTGIVALYDSHFVAYMEVCVLIGLLVFWCVVALLFKSTRAASPALATPWVWPAR